MTQYLGKKGGPFVEGQPFDIPDGDLVTQEKIEEDGTADRVELVGQTGPPNHARRVLEVANADLRGDPLTHEQDAELAASLTQEEIEEVTAHNDESKVSSALTNKSKKTMGKVPAHQAGSLSGKRGPRQRRAAEEDAQRQAAADRENKQAHGTEHK